MTRVNGRTIGIKEKSLSYWGQGGVRRGRNNLGRDLFEKMSLPRPFPRNICVITGSYTYRHVSHSTHKAFGLVGL
jgi:hypothetical protein